MEFGEVNCTTISILLYMFLRLNSFECMRMYTKNHSFVLTKVKDEYNKRINFASIDLQEAETIDATRFLVKDLISYEKTFEGFIYEQDFNECATTEKLHGKLFTPIYKYYEEFVDSIRQISLTKLPLENITYHLNGLKHALGILIDKKYTNGTDQWKIKYLPRIGNKCTIFLNLNDLGRPIYSDVLNYDIETEQNYRCVKFESLSKNGKCVNLRVANVKLQDIYKTKPIDCNLKINKYDFVKYETFFNKEIIANDIKLKNNDLDVIEYNIINNKNEVVKTGTSKVIEIA